MKNVVTYFNRHQSMDSATREEVMDLICDLGITENCPTSNIVNALYGSFDGYDYSQYYKNDPVFQSLNDGGNSHLADRINKVFATISKYPRTTEPNGGLF